VTVILYVEKTTSITTVFKSTVSVYTIFTSTRMHACTLEV